MGEKLVFTQLAVVPNVASTEHPVKVSWAVGEDVRWCPTGDDEIRVYNTLGVLLSDQQMWNCVPMGEGDASQRYMKGEGVLSAPATEGSYVVCLYDKPSHRRVFSCTLRVTGSKIGLPIEIDVKQAEVAPHGRVDVAYNPKILHSGYLALCDVHDPDNRGMTERNPSPFGASMMTVPAPSPDLLESMEATSFALVAPPHPGTYQIRYLHTCKTKILKSVALSNSFVVNGAAHEEAASVQTVAGTIEFVNTPKLGVKVGDCVTVAWDIHEGLQVISELDCIFMYPYGRPEAVRQTDKVAAVLPAKLAKWRMELEVPGEAGRYEVGYFSHRFQKFILNGPSILVVGESAHFAVDVGCINSTLDDKVTLHWKVDELVYRRSDRVMVYTEGMALYGTHPMNGCTGYEARDDSDPLAKAHEVLFAKKLVGSLSIKFDRPGKYVACYYSRALGRVLATTEAFKLTVPEAVPFPLKDLRINVAVRKVQAPSLPIHLTYCVSGYPAEDFLLRHCVGVFKAADRDAQPHDVVESIFTFPALRVYWINERPFETVCLRAIEEPGEYHVRYLTPTGLGCWSAVLSYSFRVATPEEEAQGGALLEDFHQLPLSELAEPTVLLPDVDGEGIYPFDTSEDGIGQSFDRKKANGTQFVVSVMDGRKRASVDLRVNLETEYSGAILMPKTGFVGEMLIVSYHLLGGVGRAQDRLILLDEHGTKVISEVGLENCLGRADFSLGTVFLKSPVEKGLYMAAYYSSKHESVVIFSPLCRVLTKAADLGTKDSEELLTRTNLASRGREHSSAHMHRLSHAIEYQASKRASLAGAEAMRKAHDATTRKLRAVLVGAACQGTSYPLRAPSNDTALMQDCLLKHFPHADEGAIVVLNEALGLADPSKLPTALHIREALQDMVKHCGPHDQLLFYFSGLGSRCNSYASSENDGYDCCLLPTDHDWRERSISFAELRRFFLDAPDSVEVTVILDCSFVPNTIDIAVQRGIFSEDEVSGTAVHAGAQKIKAQRVKMGWDDRVVSRCLVPPQGTFHGYYKCKARASVKDEAWDEDLGGLSTLLAQCGTSRANDFAASPPERTKCYLLQACTGEETAYERFMNGRYYGLFTWALVDAIGSLSSHTAPANPMWYRIVLHETQRVLATLPYRQTPRLCVADPEDIFRPMFEAPPAPSSSPPPEGQ
eukprot:TRINITY_DN16403_c0_g1_i1.p1 TRINITY_DN16403_c0_g1~~TRINITY_DN16403_c0_g1_i1.p1  ORF type:complete len:1174 (+),score=402.41 TRINITY_DN16403_c0_g1_i1:200-3721(+)